MKKLKTFENFDIDVERKDSPENDKMTEVVTKLVNNLKFLHDFGYDFNQETITDKINSALNQFWKSSDDETRSFLEANRPEIISKVVAEFSTQSDIFED